MAIWFSLLVANLVSEGNSAVCPDSCSWHPTVPFSTNFFNQPTPLSIVRKTFVKCRLYHTIFWGDRSLSPLDKAKNHEGICKVKLTLPCPPLRSFPRLLFPSLLMLDSREFKFLRLFSHLRAFKHTSPLHSSLHLVNSYSSSSLSSIASPFSAQTESGPELDTPRLLGYSLDQLSGVICRTCFPLNSTFQEGGGAVSRACLSLALNAEAGRGAVLGTRSLSRIVLGGCDAKAPVNDKVFLFCFPLYA